MSEKLLVPDIGDFENVEVIELLVNEGDQIKENDPIVTIESDKSSVEIPSTLNGKIDTIEVKVGDKVSKGDLLLTITSSENISPSLPPSLSPYVRLSLSVRHNSIHDRTRIQGSD